MAKNKPPILAEILAELKRRGITRYRLAVDLKLPAQKMYPWLDGSVRAPDAEMRRIVERLGGEYHAARAEFKADGDRR